MHLLHPSSSGPCFLLWCCLIYLTPLTAAALAQAPPHPQASSPPLIDCTSGQADSRSWSSRVRDSVLRTLFRIPKHGSTPLASARIQAVPNAPSSVVARYGGDVVLRFNISTEEEAKSLSEAVQVLFLDVWEFNTAWVDIRLSKDTVPSLLNLLPTSLQYAHTPLMHDLAQTIFESYPSPALSHPSSPPPGSSRPFGPELHRTPEETNIFFRDYQPLSVILPWMRLLRSLFPTHVRLLSVGTSYEGRDIPALRVGVHPTNDDQPSEPRKTIIVTGGAHAREWISTSTVNYAAYSFITAYGRDRETTKLLEKFDFLFIPTLNPDGYAYTWETDRLWRKNRQQTTLRFCKGLDLDHAYGFQWDTSAALNDNPCSESFSGENPFEAVEARRFADWARNETQRNNVDFVGFIDLHSYSQQILYPYSYSCATTPANLETLEELAIGLSKAIRLTHGERYDIASACEGSIPQSERDVSTEDRQESRSQWPQMETRGGSALDWFYHELGVSYAYQLKLRDTGSYGFLLPKENIVPTGKEIFKAIEYFGHFLNGNKGIEDKEHKGVSSDAKLSLPKHGEQADDEEGSHAPMSSNEGEQAFKTINPESVWDLRKRRRR